MGIIELNQFGSRLQSYDRLDYAGDFKGFWRWKLRTETKDEHILDDSHRTQTYHRLRSILPRWGTYRGAPGIRWREILEDSLERMSEAYDQIRSYSLLEFDKVPDEPLKSIWHELGRVKEHGGNRNPGGCYYIVAISKPLMFLWGQTLAFDSIVRTRVPRSYNVPRDTRWYFEEWKSVMERFQEGLKQQPEDVKFFKEISNEKYGTDSLVPYGQFLDLYYWVEGKEH